MKGTLKLRTASLAAAAVMAAGLFAALPAAAETSTPETAQEDSGVPYDVANGLENSFRYKYERYIRENGDKPDQKRKAMTAVATKVARVAHAIVKQDIDYKGYYEISHGT